MMRNDYYDYQRDIIESQLMQRIDWEQEQADMANYYNSRKQQIIDDIVDSVGQIESEQQSAARKQEMEDLRLAADLREMADRLEARYK